MDRSGSNGDGRGDRPSPAGEGDRFSLAEIRKKLDVLLDRVLRKLQAESASPGSRRPGEPSPRRLGKIEYQGYDYVVLKYPSTTRKRLTPRERQVAVLASRGMHNRAIAEKLGISKATVATHLSRVYLKLGVRSRIGLAHKSILFS